MDTPLSPERSAACVRKPQAEVTDVGALQGVRSEATALIALA